MDNGPEEKGENRHMVKMVAMLPTSELGIESTA
jgi:hypothetical protein